MELNNLELDLAEKIINIGLAKASDSMAFFTKEKVLLNSLEVTLKELATINSFSEKHNDENIAILSTELIGELTGICFLIFSEADCKKIEEVCLPEQFRSDVINSTEMLDALLLEMDNIIAASVITQFSNIFKFKVHGGVPGIKRIKVSELTPTVKNMSKNPSYMLYFKSNFNTYSMNINPEFVWLLDDNFINGVKKIASDQSAIESLNRLIAQ